MSAVTWHQMATVIDKLATDPVGVLRENFILGIRESYCQCPVARYVKQQLNVEKATVTSKSVQCEFVRLELPKVVSKFVVEFDNGCYPDLIQSETVS